MNEQINIAIVDDETLFRHGMVHIINKFENLNVMIEAESGPSLIQALDQSEELPEILLLDLKMPGMNGMEVAGYMHQNYPSVHVIVLSLHFSESFVTHMIELGAAAYLAKNSDPSEVYETIVQVMKNGFHYSRQVTAMMRNQLSNKNRHAPTFENAVKLTRREKEVLQLICQQRTNAEIADILFVSPKTVAGHRNNLLSKTAARNTAGLVIYALRYGITTLEETQSDSTFPLTN